MAAEPARSRRVPGALAALRRMRKLVVTLRDQGLCYLRMHDVGSCRAVEWMILLSTNTMYLDYSTCRDISRNPRRISTAGSWLRAPRRSWAMAAGVPGRSLS